MPASTLTHDSLSLLNLHGPLAKVWLAAHYERRLNKKEVVNTSISRTVEAIVRDRDVQQFLRLASQLLIGVVRIYSRKTKYLLDDCNEAMLSLQMAFRAANSSVDLVNEISAAHINQITLPDLATDADLAQFSMFDLGEWESHILASDISRRLSQAKLQDITLSEAVRPLTPERMRGLPQLQNTFATAMDLDFNCPPVDFDLGFNDYDSWSHNNNHFDYPEEIEVGRRSIHPAGINTDANALLFSHMQHDVIKGGTPTPSRISAVSVDIHDQSPLINPLDASNVLQGILPQTPRSNRESSIDGVAINSGATLLFSSPMRALGVPIRDPEPHNVKRRRAIAFDEVMDIDADVLSKLIKDTSSLIVPESSVLAAPVSNKNALSKINDKLFNSPLLSGLCDDILAAYPNNCANKRRRLSETVIDLKRRSELPALTDNAADLASNVNSGNTPVNNNFQLDSTVDFADMDFDYNYSGYDMQKAQIDAINTGEQAPSTTNLLESSDNIAQLPILLSSQFSQLSLIDDDAINLADTEASDQFNGVLVNGYSLSTISAAREISNVVSTHNSKGAMVDANHILNNKAKADAARMFYEMLLLGTRGAISLSQERAFGNINVHIKSELARIASLC